MGILSLFKKDWPAEVDRAEERLAAGDAVQALEIARRASRGDAEVRERALEIVDRARQELLRNALAKADAAEADEQWEDAADWLLSALDQIEDEARREKLEVRREALLERSDEVHNPFAAGVGPDAEEADDEEAVDGQAYYETLVHTLDEAVAPLYAERPLEFQKAYIDLNEGRGEEALEVLESLLAAAQEEDPVLRLERGRALLVMEELERAREDFEAVWPSFGDGPLDAGDSISLPVLWAETVLADDSAAVLKRLEPLSDPRQGRLEICYLYVKALLDSARHDEAEEYLGDALYHFPQVPRFSVLLARVLHERGATDEAIDSLESAVAPACAGNCGVPPHPPSFRMLADLHLARAEATAENLPEEEDEDDYYVEESPEKKQLRRDLERAGELMAFVAHYQGGMLGAEDHTLLERYYTLAGNTESAEHCHEEAERLRESGDVGFSPAPPQLGGGEKVL